MGEQTSSHDLAAGAQRDEQIVAPVGNPSSAPQTSRKIERQVCGGNRWQGDAFSRCLQEANGASTCSILMLIGSFPLVIFPGDGTSYGVLLLLFSLNINISSQYIF